MIFKQLPSRLHHILFYTHTVSGIVISFALFIIFYAGAFALFREELFQWQDPIARHINYKNYDLDKSVETLQNEYPQYPWTDRFNLIPPSEAIPLIQFRASYQDKETKERKSIWAYIHPETYEVTEKRTTLGETIYELHFFDQIPYRIGIYLAGLVAVFFLFATVTGVLIHWKDTVKKFYDFSIRGSAKQVWKNAHTVLGLLGVPFYVMYGITGSLLALSILLLLPSGLVMYEGDTEKLVNAIRPEFSVKVDTLAKEVTPNSIQERYEDFVKNTGYDDVHFMLIANYGKEDATILFNVDDHETITGEGSAVYSLQTGKEIMNLLPQNKKYEHQVLPALVKLHYATFGGFLLKIIYFGFSMITCFMILSGVLLWQKVRDNNKYTSSQRRFHHKTTLIYLAICLSLFPAVGSIFLANKLIPMTMEGRESYVNIVFFGVWLFLIVMGVLQNNYSKINRLFLRLGGLLAILIPVINGVMTGDWIWKTFAANKVYVFSIDIFWLFTGLVALWIAEIKNKDSITQTKY